MYALMVWDLCILILVGPEADIIDCTQGYVNIIGAQDLLYGDDPRTVAMWTYTVPGPQYNWGYSSSTS